MKRQRAEQTGDTLTISLASFIWSYYTSVMSDKLRKVTVNLPEAILARALSVTGRGITPTIVEALEDLDRRAHRSALRSLRGRVHFDLDLGRTRR